MNDVIVSFYECQCLFVCSLAHEYWEAVLMAPVCSRADVFLVRGQ